MMRLKEVDINRIIFACEHYKNSTGSEFIWDQYEDLIKTLKTYLEQYSTEDE